MLSRRVYRRTDLPGSRLSNASMSRPGSALISTAVITQDMSFTGHSNIPPCLTIEMRDAIRHVSNRVLCPSTRILAQLRIWKNAVLLYWDVGFCYKNTTRDVITERGSMEVEGSDFCKCDQRATVQSSQLLYRMYPCTSITHRNSIHASAVMSVYVTHVALGL